ncbi:hypothetical protein FISHEDRAFT_69757 [Fistulina hepatica ATCC 64428]|uniref:DNA/RNA polymerase n=1 Tax=Fistulina hepatica ATCC 64428 TaxID=1128425 RepID=A0A0D7ALU1_9AGAR|nr:hypothetical protein FISHEDRAFT_69757 [Fistulina hepatica ATCC 64428]
MSTTQEDHVERPQSSSLEIQTDAISACESIVERFRSGDISRTRAVAEIQRSIPYTGDFEDEQELTAHESAIQSFIAKLDSFERIRTAAIGGGVPSNERSTTDHGSHNNEEEEITVRENKRRKRTIDSEEEDDDNRSGRKLDIACLLWNSRKPTCSIEGASAELPAMSIASQQDLRTSSILKTVEILDVINVDAKQAKINLLLSLKVPQFPESQWSKLLSGATVDFDQVLSGVYASAEIGRTTEHIGNLEFSYTSTAPTKRVTNFGDWTTAFDSFAAAFIFIFPHRVDEVRDYSEHIKDFFKARSEHEHGAVIAYDSAVRTRVTPLELPAVQDPAMPEGRSVEERLDDKAENHAGTGTPDDATGQRPHVIMPISAPGAVCEDMLRESVKRTEGQYTSEEKPRYARHLVWSDGIDHSVTSKVSLAEASITMSPLPEPPEEEYMNITALDTIQDKPHLFKVDTAVNIVRFEELLVDHPNPSLVASVCRGLRDGFWPWASHQGRDYPETYDNAESRPPLSDPAHVAFAREQFALEVNKRCFSQPFGPTLLPGMYGVPIWVVPKPHSDKLRLVVDHSAGAYSLNSMIPKSERTVHLDGLQQLGQALIRARREHGDKPLVIWKSDISEAYRLLPMNPLWQIKQTVVFDAKRHVDWRNNFGGGGSGRIWTTFFALVLWIALFIKFILDLFAYVDDAFSWDFTGNLVWYEPYHAWYPRKQVLFLQLLDDLGIPHEKRKQEWGTSLVVIGLLVDTVTMTISMPDQSRLDLITVLRSFAVPRQRRHLCEFQQLGGWINWALNVYPLLRPGLSTLYSKIKGKEEPYLSIWVSVRLCHELLWIAEHLETSPGIYIMTSRVWSADDADLVVFTDASKDGIAYFIPSLNLGFQCANRLVRLPRGISPDRIFYFEALAVISAIVQILQPTAPTPRRLAIWTDNTNTVDIFNSFHALPSYNPLLVTSVNLLLQYDCQLHVLHVEGKRNTIADALSRFRNDTALSLSPGL